MATSTEIERICGTFYLEYSKTAAKKSPSFPGYCGYVEDKNSSQKVFIRRYDLINDDSDTKESRRDLEVLQKSTGQRLHENFIRFMGSVKNSNFLYAATEFCEYSVEDLFHHNAITDGKTDNESFKFLTDVRNQMGAKEILRQSTEGVAFLHGLGYLHRNLKPSNFRISCYENAVDQNQTIYQIKITDFRKTKDFKKISINSGSKGSDGWIAPECIELGFLLSQAVDVFILGNFFYYVLFGGIHPFDEESKHKDRELRIASKDYDFYKKDVNFNRLKQLYNTWWTTTSASIDTKEDTHETIKHAIDLIKQMVKFLPKERIESKEIAKHAYFNPSGNYTIYCESKKPGLLLLFSHTKFVNKGSDVSGHNYDEEKLRKVFQEVLGFDVEVHRNYYADQIEKTVLNTAQDEENKLKDYSCLAVCILSHGNSEGIYGSDLEEVAIHKLQYAFNSNDCPALHNKPKIFIIQACRIPQVKKLDDKNLTSSFEMGKKSYYYDPTKDFTGDLERPFIQSSTDNVSPVNDFLCAMATIKGSPAYASSRGNSEFIGKLCHYLENGEQNGDLESILRHVQTDMGGKDSVFSVKKTNDGSHELCIQTIERITSLRKKIVLEKTRSGELKKSEDFSKTKLFNQMREAYTKYYHKV